MSPARVKPRDPRRESAAVDAYVETVTDAKRRADLLGLIQLLRLATGQPPVLWGTALVGFGRRWVRAPAGPPLEWFLVGCSSRPRGLTLYLGAQSEQDPAKKRLGAAVDGHGWLAVRRLADLDQKAVLEVVRRLVDAQSPAPRLELVGTL